MKQVNIYTCGGCKYCERAHNQWSRFEEEVDDVVPLAITQLLKSNTIPSVRQVTVQDADQDSQNDPWILGYSKEELKKRQFDDPDLKPIINWFQLNDPEVPTSGDLMLQSASTKSLWHNKNLLLLQNGLLYYNWKLYDGFKDKPLFIVPEVMKSTIIQMNHNIPMAGHNGQENTLRRVRRGFYWYGMRKDIKQYVKTCSVCNRNKKVNHKPKAKLKSYHAGIPMERVHMDILGPLNISKRGNKFVLVMVDQFTKWIEIQALPHQGAELIAETALNEFFSRMGCPLQIHTDQGRNFDGQLIRRLCELMQITKTRTTPYRPSSNGQCERYNRTILFMIRAFKEKNTEWDIYLQQIAGAIRSTVNDSTGYTPNMLMLGREAMQPIDLMIENVNDDDINPADFVKNMSAQMKDIHHLVRMKLKAKQARQKRDYDVKSFVRTYEEGDLIYKVDDSTEIGVSKKLRSPWVGPYLITKVLSPELYLVRGRKSKDVLHHDKLMKCEDREIPICMRRLRNQFLDGKLSEEIDTDIWENDLNLSTLFDETNNLHESESCDLNKKPREKHTDSSKRTTIPQTHTHEISSPKRTRTGRSVNLPSRYR